MAPPTGVLWKFRAHSEGAPQLTEKLPRINLRPTHVGLSNNFAVLETLCIVRRFLDSTSLLSRTYSTEPLSCIRDTFPV
jgi:hypothetical protein